MSEEDRLKARQYHLDGDTAQAIALLTSSIKKDPSNVAVAMDMVQIFIDLSEIEQAKNLFNRLPSEIQTSDTGVSLSGQIWITEQANKTLGLANLKARLLTHPDDSNARFDCAICELAQHAPENALDHLFYIQQYDSEFKDGAAKELIISIINTIKENNPETAQKFRTKLSLMLS